LKITAIIAAAVLGYGLVSWGIVLATGHVWIWPIAGGALLLLGAAGAMGYDYVMARVARIEELENAAYPPIQKPGPS
jgi:hypothetical protein